MLPCFFFLFNSSVRNYVKDVLEILSMAPKQDGYEKALMGKIVVLSSEYKTFFFSTMLISMFAD